MGGGEEWEGSEYIIVPSRILDHAAEFFSPIILRHPRWKEEGKKSKYPICISFRRILFFSFFFFLFNVYMQPVGL